MKRLKKAVIITVILYLGAGLYADDGSWSKSFTISGGSIYSEEDDKNIVLEKELLIFNGRTTRAVFQFRNTSSREIRMTCGFPIIHDITSFPEEGYLEIPMGAYGNPDIPEIGFFETKPHPYYTDDEPMYVYHEIIPMTPANNRRNFITPEEAKKAGIDFRIEQDGNPVPVEDVLLERKADEEGASLTFHFRHDLVFPGSGTTKVEAEYSQDLLFGSDGMNLETFRWSYVIGTGGTWKGPIGEFYFIKPAAWKGDIPGMAGIFTEEPAEIYYARNYEPDIDDEFSLRCTPLDMMVRYEYLDSFPKKKEMWASASSKVPLPESPAQSIVSNISASSFLSDRVKVFTREGVIESAGFGPLAAFDGLEETSWCENEAGNGEGEYLEFTLNAPAAGITIRNGFKRFPADDWVFDSVEFDRRIRDDQAGLKDYFTMNSRIKVLEISNPAGGTPAVLPLDDRRDPQSFFGLELNPGTYRLTIREVYPGSRWEDTCLGEVTLIPRYPESGGNGDDALVKFYSDPFYIMAVDIERF